MAGPEILFGVAGILTPLLATPVGTAIHKRFHKPRYDYYSDRDEVCSHFRESWTSLNSTVIGLLSVIATLAHDDQVRRVVLKELERITKIFQDANSHLLACKPIGDALKEKEKTEIFLEAVEKKIGETRIMTDEKMAAMLGSIVTAKLSSSSLDSPSRANNVQAVAGRNPQIMGHGSLKFYDEGFFEHSQSQQPLRTVSSRLNDTQNSKYTRNTTSQYIYEGLKPHHHHRKRHHSSPSSSRSSSTPPSSFHIGGYPHDPSSGHEKRYRGDKW